MLKVVGIELKQIFILIKVYILKVVAVRVLYSSNIKIILLN